MTENSNVSTLVLKNEGSSGKRRSIKSKENKINAINVQKNMEVIPEQIESEQNQYNENRADPSIFGFGIDAIELEKIISKYKERGADYQDIKYFEDTGGPEKLFEALKTDCETGITNSRGREEIFGSNKVFTEEVPHFCMFVWEALEDLMVRILIASAIVQIILSTTMTDDKDTDWVDGASIVLAILTVVLVGSITNYQKELKFHELNEIQSEGTKYTVIRSGTPEELISDDLLVGDLISVSYGDVVTADLILVEGNGIKMDESALTGESDAMKKEPFQKCLELKKRGEKVPSPIILSGTHCIEGSGKGIVLAVGDHSQKGIIKRTVSNAQEKSKTPLEIKLDRIAELIGYFGLAAGVVTLIALFIRFAVKLSIEMKEYDTDSKLESIMTGILQNYPHEILDTEIKSHTNNQLINPTTEIAAQIIDIIILCVSIIVVAIPEGLPLAVTLSLTFSIKKMMDRNNLVRKMHACETMGGANVICTDKTGTLTKNEMSVFKILTGSGQKELAQNIEVHDVGKIDDDATIRESKKKNKNNAKGNTVKQIREDYTTVFNNDKFWNTLKVAVALNVDATISQLEEPDINGDYEICETKNKTDKAFIELLYRFRSPISVEKEKYLSEEGKFKQFPFDSKRKRMTTFILNKEFPKGGRLFSKGGAENVSVFCNTYMDPETGNIKTLDNGTLARIKNTIEEFNKNKLRSLYIAYKDITEDEFNKCEKEDKNKKLIDQYNLTFLAVFGIKDSLRDGVKEAVQKCKDASVNVIMVTGDNIITATAIAKECGILGDDIDLVNLARNQIEDNPEQMNDKTRKYDYMNELLIAKPKAITGNSFYNIIGGLICEECHLDTNLCKCPKTEAEAKQRAKELNKPQKPIKKDAIKNIGNFRKITQNLKVMARSQPLHKYALVLGFKALGSVVAVTGDGTNDAPALSKSDVGFAMFAGTDIAKQASDIVIIDNNFSSIITAIIYGRNIYDNIRKFLQFQLTVNFCACLIVFICACIGNETPLTPIQMLWVNLIMDSLGSLALATEPPYEELLQRVPTKRNESIINGKMWKHILIQSVTQIVILLILYLLAPKFIREYDLVRLTENALIKYCYGSLPGNSDPKNIIYGTESSWDNNIRILKTIDIEECGGFANRLNLNMAYQEYYKSNGASSHMTILFNVFVYYTLFNQINCRVIDDTFNIFIRMNKSLLFPLICSMEMGLQAIIINYGNEAFHVVERGICLSQWGFTALFSLITFAASAIVKLIPLERFLDKILAQTLNKRDKLHEEEMLQKHKLFNDDAQSIDSIQENDPQIVIHKKAKYDDRNEDTGATKEIKNVMSYRSNNKMKL